MAKRKGPRVPFSVGSARYQIPSKLYPLSSPRRFFVIGADECEDVEVPGDVRDAMDSQVWESGRCYGNTARVVSLWPGAKYFSGWLFARSRFPYHHAWAVVGDSVVDMSISRGEIEYLTGVDYDDPQWREKAAPVLFRMSRESVPSRDRVIGKPIEGFIYVGCEDDLESARGRFRKLMRDYPDHPSYARKIDPAGYSELQRVLERERGRV
jgi:hypothetical protein